MALLLKELNMERRCLINSGLKKSTDKLRKNQWQAVTKVLYHLVWYKKPNKNLVQNVNQVINYWLKGF